MTYISSTHISLATTQSHGPSLPARESDTCRGVCNDCQTPNLCHAHRSPWKQLSRRMNLYFLNSQSTMFANLKVHSIFLFWDILVLTRLFIQVEKRGKLNNLKSIDHATLEWKTAVSCPGASRNVHSPAPSYTARPVVLPLCHPSIPPLLPMQNPYCLVPKFCLIIITPSIS